MTDAQPQMDITPAQDDEKLPAVHSDSFSFIVRVWKESTTASDENPAGWRGSIERVGLNQRMYIHRLESIQAFIEEQIGMRARRLHPISAVWNGVRSWWNNIRDGNRYSREHTQHQRPK